MFRAGFRRRAIGEHQAHSAGRLDVGRRQRGPLAGLRVAELIGDEVEFLDDVALRVGAGQHVRSPALRQFLLAARRPSKYQAARISTRAAATSEQEGRGVGSDPLDPMSQLVGQLVGLQFMSSFGFHSRSST